MHRALRIPHVASRPTIRALPAVDRYLLVYRRGLALLTLGLLLGGVGFLLQSARILAFPYETGPWEDSEHLAIERLSRGVSCYGWPGIGSFPPAFYPYTPLYPAVAGALERLGGFVGIGSGLWSGRMVTLAATLALAWLTFCVVFKKTGDRRAAAIATLTLIALEPNHRFLNVGRPDTLALALGMAAVAVLGSERAAIRWRFVPLAALAALTKQPMLAFAAVGLIYTFGRNRREAISQLAALTAVLAISSLVLNLATHGAFWNDTVVYQTLVRSDTIHAGRGPISSFLTFFGRLLTWSIVPEALAIMYLVRHRAEVRSPGGQWLVAYVGVTLMTLLSLFHWGASANRLVPAVAVTNVLFGFALAELPRWIRDANKRNAAWLAAAPALAVLSLLFHVSLIEPTATSSTERTEMDAVKARIWMTGGSALCELPRIAAEDHRTGVTFEDLVLLKGAFGPQAKVGMENLRSEIAAGKFQTIALYEGFGKPCALLPPPAYEAMRQRYHREATYDAVQLEVWEPNDNVRSVRRLSP